MKTFLSIDIGTSSAKCSLFDARGQLLASLASSYPVDYPRPEWAEQDPAAWWGAVCELGPQIMAENAGHSLAGISISGQTPGCVPVDEDGVPLRPAILWLDRRASPQVSMLRNYPGEEACRAISKNRLDSYFGGLKWLWFRQEEPGLFEHTWQIMQANGYVLYHLTGQSAIDPAQAGLCSPCFNASTGTWDEGICREMGLPLELLPPVRPAWSVVGAVTARAAAETGLPEGTPVVCSGADFACAALGAGVLGPGLGHGSSRAGEPGAAAGSTGNVVSSGEAAESVIGAQTGALEYSGPLEYSGAMMLGTAGNLLFPGARSADPRLLHTIHLTGQPLPFGGVMAGGNLAWFAGLLGQEDNPTLFKRLDEEAAQVPPGSEGLLFLPYLMGARTPDWDPAARGAFVGLSSRHTRAHLYRAILEGVAFTFRAISEVVGAEIHAITAIDGGARSPLWRSILASALGVPIRQGGERSGTALGSAFLAALGTGAVESFAAIEDWVEVLDETHPDLLAEEAYARSYAVYKGLYGKLREDFEALR